VIPVLAVHDVNSLEYHKRVKMLGEATTPSRTTASDVDTMAVCEWCMVMPRAERSLHDIISREFWVGRSPDRVARCLREVAECVATLHRRGIVHADIKPRNIVRYAHPNTTGSQQPLQQSDVHQSEKMALLIDLGNMHFIGSPLEMPQGSCSAYYAPELARTLLFGSDTPDAASVAEPAQDIFALGATFFEVVTRTGLFGMNRADDSLGRHSVFDLVNWLQPDERHLSSIFSGHLHRSDLSDSTAKCRHLLVWMLQREPPKRPSIHEVLGHPFLSDAAVTTSGQGTAPKVKKGGAAAHTDERAVDTSAQSSIAQLPQRWHFFISHAQVEASGIVGTMYHLLRECGLVPWVDMQEQDLTLTGMIAGVRSSTNVTRFRLWW